MIRNINNDRRLVSLRALHIIVLLFASLWPCCYLRAQTVDCTAHWANAIQVSGDSAFYNEPRLAVVGDTVHLLWFGTDFLGTVAQDGIQYVHSFDAGLSFTAPQTLSSFDTALSPGIVAASGSSVCVAFEATIDTFSGTVVMRSSDAGISWQTGQRIQSLSSPLLLECAEGIFYLHYLDKQTNRNGLLRSTDAGTSWGVKTSNMPALASFVVRPTALHGVAAVGSNIKDIIYYTTTDLGTTWMFSEILSLEDFASSLYPRIAANGKRDLYVAWTDTGSVFLRHSANNGLSWLPEMKISDQHGAVFVDVAAHREFVSVVWDNDFDGGTLRFRPSNDNAISFCPIDLPSADSGAGGPAIKVSGSRLHVAWSKRLGISGTSGAIFYRGGALVDNPNAGDRPPRAYALQQNYPNPFNGITHIPFDLPVPAHVKLVVFSLLGQKIATLIDDDRGVGRYTASFETTKLSSGIYFYELQTPGFVERKKMIIVK